MDQFSTTNPFRPPSPAAAGMTPSALELYFQEFLEEPPTAASGGGGHDVVEITRPAAAEDPMETAALREQKLKKYCAVVASIMDPGARRQDSSSVSISSSQSLDASHLKSQTVVKGGGLGGSPVDPAMQNSGVRGKRAKSESSRDLSDDDELEGEMEMTENMDHVDTKRVRRMLSNRESARRSRRRKQAYLSELEAQVSQLRVQNSSLLKQLTEVNRQYSESAIHNRILKADVETLRAEVSQLRVQNSSLLKQLTEVNRQYSESAVHNWILKADVETLRAKVKMADDTVNGMTGVSLMFPAMSDLSPASMPFTRSLYEATSETAFSIQDDTNHFFQASAHDSETAFSIQDDTNHFFQASAHDRRVSSCIPEITPAAPPAEDIIHSVASGERINRTASMQRVASVEHLQKRIYGGPVQLDATDGWGTDISMNKKQSQV